MNDAKFTLDSTSTQDSSSVKFVREGENIASRVRQDVVMRRTLGSDFSMLGEYSSAALPSRPAVRIVL